ncbi:MAG: hypothetical protein DHS20C18_18690 [Saprospiraceae bacterium]|nr:MAG: hypothetical protein DHS20C18_18690 [Saprospiraceae bacterium]
MKNFKIVFLFVAFMASGIAFTSCGGNSTEATKTEQQGKEYTSAYICPMHCEGSGSDEAGQCPDCGMDYVKNEDHNSNGHTH